MQCIYLFISVITILITFQFQQFSTKEHDGITSISNLAIDTLESSIHKLILMRTTRNLQNSIITLKTRMRMLLKRRKLHYTKLKNARNKIGRAKLKYKLRKVQKNIRKLRRKLNAFRRGSTWKSSEKLMIPSPEEMVNVVELHEKCKNSKCSQICRVNDTIISCYCHKGFRLSKKDNRTCIDIDECKFKKCAYKCVNTMGSYYCKCPPGMKLSYDESTCMDVNECFLNNNHGPCQDKCINNEASYYCSCPRFKGTRLSANQHTCEDIDECTEKTNNCSHQCYNIYNSYICGCPEGMMLSKDHKTCIDINECTLEFMKTCIGKCINTIGSYFCLNENDSFFNETICDQLLPTDNGYYLCNRNQQVKIILKGITDREHFLNLPGTICTFYTSSHQPQSSHICNNQGSWERFSLTLMNNSST